MRYFEKPTARPKRTFFQWLLFLGALYPLHGSGGPLPEDVVFSGVRHGVLGEAQLIGGESLVVTGLGPTGLDGVRFVTRPLGALASSYDFGTGLGEAGARVDWEVEGDVGGGELETLLHFSLESEGGRLRVDVDFLLGASYRLVMRRAGAPIHLEQGVDAASDGSVSTVVLAPGSPQRLELVGAGAVRLSGLDAEANVLLTDGRSIPADEISWVAEAPSETPGLIDEVRLLGTNLAAIKVLEHSLRPRDLWLEPVGDVELISSPPTVTLVGFDTVEEYGVRAEIHRSRGFGLDLGRLDSFSMPTGSRVAVGAEGTLLGVPQAASTRISGGSELSLGFDFSGLGESIYTLELLAGDTVKAQAAGLTGDAARFHAFEGRIEHRLEPAEGYVIRLLFEELTAITLGGEKGVVLAEEIRAFPSTQPGTLPESLGTASVLAQGIPLVNMGSAMQIELEQTPHGVIPVGGQIQVEKVACHPPGSPGLVEYRLVFNNPGPGIYPIRAVIQVPSKMTVPSGSGGFAGTLLREIHVPANRPCHVGFQGFADPTTFLECEAAVSACDSLATVLKSATLISAQVPSSLPPCDDNLVVCDDGDEIFAAGFNCGNSFEWGGVFGQ